MIELPVLMLTLLVPPPGAIAYRVRVLGRLVAGDADSYRYLVESIRQFPRPEDFAAMIRKAGFSRTQWTAMSGGIVALHAAWRL